MKSKISVIGLGYVGLPLALLIAKKNHDVIGIDLDEYKVEKINDGVDPLRDEYVAKNLQKASIVATTTFEGINDSDIAIVCVPTPVESDYQPNLKPLQGAVTSIAQNMNKGLLIIIESTINPGVCDEVIIPLIEKTSGMKAGTDFHIAHCPERINPGDKKWNVENIPRVVGASDEKGLHLAVNLYENIIDATIKPMGSIMEAEAVKVVENTFRDINIAFVNELAMSFSTLGINVVNVIDGAATKPFAFMPHYPGTGVGGHCIPVDPYYLIEYARDKGFHHEFLLLARNINNGMPEFTIERLAGAMNEVGLPIKGSKIALLGVSYKPNVADDRESPSYILKRLLLEKGADLTIFDPYFPEHSSADTIDEAIAGQDALLIATAHDEIVNISPEKLMAGGIKVIADGRNCLDGKIFSEAGIIYKGVGVDGSN